MAWKYFGLEAIRFTRYDLVLEELVQAFMERRGITRPLCPQGTKITMQEAINLMNNLERLDDTSYLNPFLRQENSTTIPYSSFYANEVLAHYNMEPVYFKQPFKRLFDPMWAYQRQLLLDAMRWRRRTFNANTGNFTGTRRYGLEGTASFEECCQAVRSGEPVNDSLSPSRFYMAGRQERYNIRIWLSTFEVKNYDMIHFNIAFFSKIFLHDVSYGNFHPFGPMKEPEKSYLLHYTGDDPAVHTIITEEQRAELEIIKPQDNEIYDIYLQMNPVYCYDRPGGFSIYNQWPELNIN